VDAVFWLTLLGGYALAENTQAARLGSNAHNFFAHNTLKNVQDGLF
jgi:hypothetical protein